jgi:spore coat protein H
MYGRMQNNLSLDCNRFAVGLSWIGMSDGETGMEPAFCGRPRIATTLRRGALRRTGLPGVIGLASLLMVAAEPSLDGTKPSDLFKGTNVWTVHLKFTPDQWEAMEPKGGDGGFFGGPGGARGPGGPGGFGGPAMFLAPSFLKHGDQNQDGKLSREEFESLGGKWFTEWDKDKSGILRADQLRAGLNSAVEPPNFGPPGAGGPGGGGPRMNLQGAEGKRNGLASAMGIEFKYVHADLDFAGRPFKDVAVRYKGNGTFMQSRGSLKHSFKIDLNKHVDGQKLAGVTKLNLHNNVTDASWMNEVLSHRLFRDAGAPASRTAYARVYVTVPGKHDHQYLGLYSLVEDVDNNFAQERFGMRKGAIFKPVTPSPFADLGDDWKNYNQTYDPKTELAPEQKQRVIDFCKLVTKAGDAEFAATVGGFLELDEFARFMAVTTWLSTMDSILGPGQNYYVYLHPKTGKFQFIPWDLDHSFGQFGMMGSPDQRENLNIHRPWLGENRFLERVFNVEEFKKLYLAHLSEFSKTLFQPERFDKQVDEIAAAIRPAVKEESDEQLARFDKVINGEPVQPAGFGGFGRPRPGAEGGDGPRFGGPGGFMQPAKPIKAFVKARAQSVTDQLAGKSEGQTVGAFGFGGPGPRAGRGGGPGGPGGFGPGMFLGNAFMAALDANKDGEITRDEFAQGFTKFFKSWNTDKSGVLTGEQLRAGINQDLGPRGGPRGAPGFGPPDEPPPRER